MNSRQRVPLLHILKHYMGFAWKYPWLLLGVAVFPLLGEVFDVLPQYILRDMINIFSEDSVSKATVEMSQVLFSLFLLFTAYKGIQFLIHRLLTYCMMELEVHVMKNITQGVFSYIHGHSVGFFQDRFVGSLVKQVHRYADAFETIVDQLSWVFIPLIAQFVIGQVVLFSIHWMFGLVMLIWTVLFMMWSIGFARYKSRFDIEESEASSRLSGHLADSFSNALTVKIFAGKRYEEKVFGGHVGTHFTAQRKKWHFSALGDAIQGLMVLLVEIILLWIVIVLWQQNYITPGDVILIIGVSVALFRRIWGLGRAVNKLYSASTYAHEMMEILDLPHEIKDPLGSRELMVKGGSAYFEQVSFGYGQHMLMKDFSLSIKSGERIALVGSSGAGKSTLIKLLLRFHDPVSGRIYIDGQDIAQVTQESLHRAIAFVPQEPVLFHRTIAENISYARPESSMKEIIHAARLAHAHEFISALKDGYDTYVGERGVKLSGGERQRVAIARAILSKAPLLILDEATSALDSESEHLIKDALHTLMQGKTTIVIAHRLSTIMEMDRILVLDKGSIIEEGTHSQLLEKKGVYERLWSIQSGGFFGGVE